jgi:septum formation protein
MARLGAPFEVIESGFDEGTLKGLRPKRLAQSAAHAKAEAVVARMPARWVVAADTVVALQGLILDKPRDDEDARRMLRLLSGRMHTVLTGTCVYAPGGCGVFRAGCAQSQVHIRRLSIEEIDDYVRSGEPRDKAGAYAIQGRAGAFASLQRGNLENVVGLPLHLLRRLLRDSGYPFPAHRSSATVPLL